MSTHDSALIVVDIQNDFLPGGPLAVADGDLVVPVAQRLIERFRWVVATQDWHPADHASFASNQPGHAPGDVVDLDGLEQVVWPDHCVQETPGASFAAGLDPARFDAVFRKGTDPRIDSYSGFFDNGHRQSTGLADWLRERGVTQVAVLGLATDYCVRFTALDAIREGFATSLIEDACRGVELRPGDVAAALDECRDAGVTVLHSREL